MNLRVTCDSDELRLVFSPAHENQAGGRRQTAILLGLLGFNGGNRVADLRDRGPVNQKRSDMDGPLPAPPCPNCGTASRTRAVAWRLLETSGELERVEGLLSDTITRGIETRGGPVAVEMENRMLEVDRETYETTYRCSRCGHSWSVRSTAVKRALLEEG